MHIHTHKKRLTVSRIKVKTFVIVFARLWRTRSVRDMLGRIGKPVLVDHKICVFQCKIQSILTIFCPHY